MSPQSPCLAKIGFFLLAVPTAFSCYMMLALLDPNAEVKLIRAAFGGMGLCFVAPYWILYRRRVPLIVALLAVPLIVYGVIMANCWAAAYAGTRHTNPGYYAAFWWFIVPGLVYFVARTLIERAIQPGRRTGPKE